jgi:hypothetical protein
MRVVGSVGCCGGFVPHAKEDARMTTADNPVRRLRILAITGWALAIGMAVVSLLALSRSRHAPDPGPVTVGVEPTPTPASTYAKSAADIFFGPEPCAVPPRPITSVSELKWYLESEKGLAVLERYGLVGVQAQSFIGGLREIPPSQVQDRCRWESTTTGRRWRVCFVDSVRLVMDAPAKTDSRVGDPRTPGPTPAR